VSAGVKSCGHHANALTELFGKRRLGLWMLSTLRNAIRPQAAGKSILLNAGFFVLQTAFWFACLGAILVAIFLLNSDMQNFRYVGF
jgi:hypothetical protein